MRSIVCITLLTLTLARPVRAEDSWNDNLEMTFNDLSVNLEEQRHDFADLVRQVMLDRYQNEERIRAEGDSGLVGIRNYMTGAMNYHSFTHTSDTDFAALHDHQLTPDTVGFGEAILSMNGVQFMTKHTDYEIAQASPSSTDWRATVPIDPPDVPDDVKNMNSVAEQIDEMQQYFIAFRDNNVTHRDYKDFFKPVLCYVEGTWLSDTDTIENPNDHVFKAYEWRDLQEQARLDSLTGATTYFDQRVANLPRTVVGVNDMGKPIHAQWFYRVLCHPFTMDELPKEYFRLVDDLSFRVPNGVSIDELPNTKAARFIYDELDQPGYHKTVSMLTKLINKIPGMDNVPSGALSERDMLGRDTKDPVDETTLLDRGFYNHIFHDSSRDPFRQRIQYRGFGDANLYVAMNQQEAVAPVPIDYMINAVSGKSFDSLRLSWLLPLEVIYLTPLLKWNPYDIPFFAGDVTSSPANSVKDGNRDGTDSLPFNGTNKETFMRTPSSFYTDRYYKYRGSGDDMFKFSWVLNDKEEKKNVTASGISTFTPPIGGGVGPLRTRYPIMPLHQEGSPIWKELNGFKIFINQQFEELTKVFTQAGMGV